MKVLTFIFIVTVMCDCWLSRILRLVHNIPQLALPLRLVYTKD